MPMAYKPGMKKRMMEEKPPMSRRMMRKKKMSIPQKKSS